MKFIRSFHFHLYEYLKSKTHLCFRFISEKFKRIKKIQSDFIYYKSASFIIHILRWICLFFFKQLKQLNDLILSALKKSDAILSSDQLKVWSRWALRYRLFVVLTSGETIRAATKSIQYNFIFFSVVCLLSKLVPS